MKTSAQSKAQRSADELTAAELQAFARAAGLAALEEAAAHDFVIVGYDGDTFSHKRAREVLTDAKLRNPRAIVA